MLKGILESVWFNILTLNRRNWGPEKLVGHKKVVRKPSPHQNHGWGLTDFTTTLSFSDLVHFYCPLHTMLHCSILHILGNKIKEVFFFFFLNNSPDYILHRHPMLPPFYSPLLKIFRAVFFFMQDRKLKVTSHLILARSCERRGVVSFL